MEDRFERKLEIWMGKLLSYGDRLVLINSVLTSLRCLCYRSLKLLSYVCEHHLST
jgi:hypothetical protein